MIKVCDAIMGSGKTEAAIAYMNEHPGSKYIFITPYLGEAERIKKSCPSLNFVTPSKMISECNFSKIGHTASLINSGRNIASTHAAFEMYTPEMLDDIREKNYTLIIDESLDVLDVSDINKYDIEILMQCGFIAKEGSKVVRTDKEYKGYRFRNDLKKFETSDLLEIDSECYYWEIPRDLVEAFTDVYVLTYMFECQSFCYFLKMNKMSYKKIFVDRSNGFHFSDTPCELPEYTKKIKDMIVILEHRKMNEVGKDRFSLSMNWFKTHPEKVNQLRKSTNNFFRNIMNAPNDEIMWGTYNEQRSNIKGKGYANGFLAFNTKATNEYANRKYLAYLSNVYVNVSEKSFYSLNGIEVSDDMYALSVMVQWIWRSAIRNGEKIYLYVPSARMRGLLINWIDSFSKGGEVA